MNDGGDCRTAPATPALLIRLPHIYRGNNYVINKKNPLFKETSLLQAAGADLPPLKRHQ
jgi:hypothetical protein